MQLKKMVHRFRLLPRESEREIKKERSAGISMPRMQRKSNDENRYTTNGTFCSSRGFSSCVESYERESQYHLEWETPIISMVRNREDMSRIRTILSKY